MGWSSLEIRSGRWHCTEGTSNKFWECWQGPSLGEFTTAWGRIGSAPQGTKSGLTYSEVVAKVKEKENKGYARVGQAVSRSAPYNPSSPQEALERPRRITRDDIRERVERGKAELTQERTRAAVEKAKAAVTTSGRRKILVD
jgi:predicted DNA-binding WGR domain protein